MRSSSLGVGLFLFALVPITGCGSTSTDEEESGLSEDAVGAASHATHAAAIAKCTRTYDAEPRWTAQDSIGAAERFHGCLMIANDRAVATMARRTEANGFNETIDTYRNYTNKVCATFFNLDGPVIIDTCVARREELLARLIGAYGDLGETAVPMNVPDNAYAQCYSDGLYFDCIDAQIRNDLTEIVTFPAVNQDMIDVVRGDARFAKSTCHLLVLRAPTSARREPANPASSSACAIAHMGATANIGRMTRP
jgi:hypothetical protein